MSSWITKMANTRGIKILDASQALDIRVNANDIKKALRKNPQKCAFARAARRGYKINAAYFLRGVAYLHHNGKLVRYRIPLSMQKEIVCFDRFGKMAAGSYQLKAIPVSQRFSVVRGRVYNKTTRKNKKTNGRHITTGIRNTYE